MERVKDPGKKANNKYRSRAEIEKSIRAQVAAEERAHKIVEKLVLEEVVTDDCLKNAAGFITPSHYSDVTVERSISKVCGYPLCNKNLSQVPKQQYRISTKTNRVYDITERKCFCSNFCFKASKYFESQIPSSPIWTRGNGRLDVKLLKKDGHDLKSQNLGAGQVLVGANKAPLNIVEGNSENVSEDKRIQIEHKRDEPECNKSDGIQEKSKSVSDLCEKQNNFCRTSLTSPGTSDANDHSDVVSNEDNQRSLTYRNTLTHTKDNCYSEVEKSKIEFYQAQKDLRSRTQRKEDIPVSPRQLIVNFLTVLLSQWVTFSTLDYLNVVNIADQRLQSREEQDGEILKEKSMTEIESFAQKMRQFFTHIDDSDFDEEDGEGGTAQKNTENDISIKECVHDKNDKRAFAVPLMDSKSQTTIRRGIVLRKLTQVLPNLLKEMQLTMAEVSGELRDLVYTFSLSSHNIVLQGAEWNVLAVFLIYMLRDCNPCVKDSLKHCNENFAELVNRLGVSAQDLDEILKKVYQSKTSPSAVIIDDRRTKSFETASYGDMENLD